ncbi:uncharacterized protein LOC130675041 [Microplitis mediator]|uniref:uncharacterized protein LOC130675041 n=1 Tax=Microplitis mediator TaxID=375433 RepID=UPI0025549BD1|nr:uncharacterized protein LOC130675041 [Microplitis mediator]
MSRQIGFKVYNYLLGYELSNLSDYKLPSYRDAINLFMYKHRYLQLTIRQSSKEVIDDINHIWITQNQNVENFVTNLDKLFDIADNNKIENLSDDCHEFLTKNREKGSYRCSYLDDQSQNELLIANNDIIEEKNNENDFDDYKNVLSQKLSQSSVSNSRCSQLSNLGELKRSQSDFEDELPKAKLRKIDVMTPELVSALDRTKTSDRNAMYIISAVITSLGFDIDKYNLSYTTIRNARISMREEIAETLKDDIRDNTQGLVVHWDGKLLPTLINTLKVERLPIIVSGQNIEQLLGVPIVEEATGINQAEIIYKVLNEWNISSRIKAMCFDTTAVNTGVNAGVCTVLEKKLGKNLLRLACRHHVYEVVLKNVAEIAWPVTNGPNVPIFNRFRNNWSMIDTTNYEIGIEDEAIKNILFEKKDEILIFIEDQFENRHPRDDYREFLELSYIFLGGIPKSGVKFKAPGAMHHARWLSKALYCLKIFMFKKQFFVKTSEMNALPPNAIKAPYCDLELLKNLIEFKKMYPQVAQAALIKLSGHLWYLHENLAVLALFDPAVSREEKLKMVDAIKNKKSTSRESKRFTVHKSQIDLVATKCISDFEQPL